MNEQLPQTNPVVTQGTQQTVSQTAVTTQNSSPFTQSMLSRGVKSILLAVLVLSVIGLGVFVYMQQQHITQLQNQISRDNSAIPTQVI